MIVGASISLRRNCVEFEHLEQGLVAKYEHLVTHSLFVSHPHKKTWAAPEAHVGPQQAFNDVVFSICTHGNKTRVVHISGGGISWTAVLTLVIIASLKCVMLDLFTPEISL